MKENELKRIKDEVLRCPKIKNKHQYAALYSKRTY